MSGQALLPIGAFARLARLTVKALRHYDAEGLLAPAETDPHSGYRYYRADQVPAATTIALLRGLGVPLAAVRRVLEAADPDAIGAVLAAERERVRAELERREEVLRVLDGLLRDPGQVRYDVAMAEREPIRLGGVTGRVRADALDADTGALCRRAVAGGACSAPLVAVFPLDLADEMDVTVGVPVADGSRGPDGSTVLPGGPWASTVHVGPYAALPLAYTAMLERVRDLGHTPDGPVTETYLTDPTTVAAADLVTRIAVACAR